MKNNRSFYLGVVLPSSLAIILFIASIQVFFIPFFEKAIMDDKKEMIAELTNTAWSLISEYESEYADSTISLQEAQQLAKERVAQIRYGSEQKDYFWIIDEKPTMIMHPYRPELIGTDLNNYYDANGKKLFVEATKVVKEQNEGFIDYMWQWKDDSTKIVPKLSSVKSFEPWGWIVGTGIYLDDVEEEIKALKNSLLIISLIIAFIIALILFYVVRQSLGIELKRRNLTAELHKSRQKYVTLVEASNEGTLMFLNESIIFSNAKFRTLCGFSQEEISHKKLEELFTTKWESIHPNFKDNTKSFSFESSLICSDNILKEVIISISKVEYADTYGYIITTKEVSRKEVAERESDKLSGEVKTSLLLMKQPIKHLVQSIAACTADTSIQMAANKMSRLKKDFLLVKQDKIILGIVTNKDVTKKAVAKSSNLDSPVASIMTAPICTISDSASLHEALLSFTSQKVSHLVTTDHDNTISGVISYESIISIQHNTLAYLLLEIENTNTVEELAIIHNKIPTLIHALAESNENTYDTVAFASSISDRITRKIIEFGIETYGPAPCKYVFMVVGSEGRREQTLLTDQDNGLIYDDAHSNEKVQEYFLELANYISDSLDQIGYNYCKGGMMACNPKWCQPLSKWKAYFSSWVDEPDIERLIEASTFIDFRTIYGDNQLSDDLRQHVMNLAQSNNEFLLKLAEMTSNFKSPINAFGNLVGNDHTSKEKTIDLKTILTPIVKYSRVSALKHGIETTNTTERIKALYEAGKISEDFYKDISLAYNYVMKIRLKNQSRLIQAGEHPVNTIELAELSPVEKNFLKSIFQLINNLSTSIVSEIKNTD
ncbi:DUF294 nucleotidyltransferase-like domain-containing protein [Carboxylicivirga sp. N1Y90]|uniref:DUF294 nucleotidyltransferase-like domain-containing protein n=1 Tax=Carboxylicivirga fragile TaxID=3417571 RepID=UPI003D33A268|nr:cache domain-containing protein [Marinilabiliaceae bacterium N1Y90]